MRKVEHINCSECSAPLFAADGRRVIDGEEDEFHSINCRCQKCEFTWWETDEPKTCKCGASFRLRADDGHIYLHIVDEKGDKP